MRTMRRTTKTQKAMKRKQNGKANDLSVQLSLMMMR